MIHTVTYKLYGEGKQHTDAATGERFVVSFRLLCSEEQWKASSQAKIY